MLSKPLITALLVAFPLAGGAGAQELAVQYAKRFKNADVSVSFSTGAPSRSYYRPAYNRPRVRGTHSYRGDYRRRGLWVPGRYESVDRRVWVPGFWEKVWIEPVFDFRYDECGTRVRFLVRDGYYKQVFRPGCWTVKRERVWRPGFWKHRY